jgi:hypothetical protein
MDEFNLPINKSKDKKALVAELKQLFKEAYTNTKDKSGFYNKIVQKAQDLKTKYPEEKYEDYEMWHVLIGSTPTGSFSKFDFPEREIEEFIRSASK